MGMEEIMKTTVFVSLFALLVSIAPPRAEAVDLVLTEMGSAPVTNVFFGSVDVQSSDTRALVLSNASAEGLALQIRTNGPGFYVDHDCGCALAAGASCSVYVTFQPTMETGYSGGLHVKGFGEFAEMEISVPLSGFGRASSAKDAVSGSQSSAVRKGLRVEIVATERSDVVDHMSPPPSGYIDFGNVRVMDYAYRTLRLTNDSDTPIVDLDLAVSGYSYGGRTDCTASLPPGGSCRVQLEFRPMSQGGHHGQFRAMASNVQGLTMDLMGWGVN